MIKKFKDSLTNVKPILKEIEEIEVIRKLEIEQIKETTKKRVQRIRNRKNGWIKKVGWKSKV